MIRLRDLAPEFAAELAALLIAEDEPNLAEQILEAEIVERCSCEAEFCASFSIAPAAEGGYDDGIQLGLQSGCAIVDVANGRLMHVEVVNNPEFRRRLRLALP